MTMAPGRVLGSGVRKPPKNEIAGMDTWGVPCTLQPIDLARSLGSAMIWLENDYNFRVFGMSIAIWGKYLLDPQRFQRVRRGKKDTANNLCAMGRHPALRSNNHKAHRSSIEKASTDSAIFNRYRFPLSVK